jgi:large subunit ribosomal protein L25
MDAIILELEKREVSGKAVKHLRRDGQVPAVIHDHGKPSIIVMAPYAELLKVCKAAGKNHPVSLKAGGKAYTALIKEATFSPKKNLLTHVVFNAVSANQTVTAEVPIHITYSEGNDSTPAERNGLIVLRQLETVEVEAIPNALPNALSFDGEKLVEVGDHATVADLTIPKGVIVKTEVTHTLATVFEPSALAAANDAAGGDAEDTDASSEETAEADATAPAAGTEDKKA